MGATVLILGAGAVGTVVALQLGRSRHISKIILGDVSKQRAEAAANRVDNEKVMPSQIDAGDKPEIAKRMVGANVVINTSLPKFNLTIMEVALGKRTHYIDLASEGTYDKQLERDEAWRRAGLTAILGMGEDPGLSNVLARYAADDLDRVHSIRIRDGETATSERYPLVCLFSPEVFLGEIFEPAFYYESGAFRTVEPFQGREVYPFREPVGPVPVYYVAHEETRTLPLSIGKGVRYVDFKLAIPDDTLHILQMLKRLNLTRKAAISVGGSSIAPIDLLAKLIPSPSDISGEIQGYAALAIVVEGKRNSVAVKRELQTFLSHRDAHEKYRCSATSYLTGTPAAVAAEMLLTEEIKEPGAMTPELLDPKPFLKRILKSGIAIRDSGETLRIQ